MGFDSREYLRGLGWSGPGTGLRSNSRSKPITVVQKKTMAGVGKERDTSFAWWEMVFTATASKVGSPAAEGGSKELRTTSTGILSSRPPPSGSSSAAPSRSGTSTPSYNPSTDILGQAKKEAARRQLYTTFLRGCVIEGNTEEFEEPSMEMEKEPVASTSKLPVPQKQQAPEEPPKPTSNNKVDSSRLRRLAASGFSGSTTSSANTTDSEPDAEAATSDAETAAERKARKKARKAKREEKKLLRGLQVASVNTLAAAGDGSEQPETEAEDAVMVDRDEGTSSPVLVEAEEQESDLPAVEKKSKKGEKTKGKKKKKLSESLAPPSAAAGYHSPEEQRLADETLYAHARAEDEERSKREKLLKGAVVEGEREKKKKKREREGGDVEGAEGKQKSSKKEKK